MKKNPKQLTLAVPDQAIPLGDFLTESGTFLDGNMRVNKNGLQLISQENVTRPMDVKGLDLQFCLEDLETVKIIGHGSGAAVKLARRKDTGALFAVKGIHLNFDEKVRKQIVQELRINQTAKCPYIVSWYQSFYHDGIISLVLEYMDRGSLSCILKQLRKINEPELSIICKQVLRGLVYLHNERRIIHRDIKPSNLLVNKRGEVKIADFGVSAMLARSKEERITVTGTCNYMSPERISNAKYGYKSDIWSLGLVILECAIGRFPYVPSEEEGWSNIYELLETIVNQPPPSATDEFSPEFRSFISSCLQKDPKRRMSSLQLLGHPFIEKYNEESIDLQSLVSDLQSPNNTGDRKCNIAFRASDITIHQIA
ncbi:mitogen-activated protein kinase kinase 1-like isoform X1 [Ananas comosus]|uniref:mitogen-activated protein kinase kinase n=2 Tax=Ananas comosus TaxID=4615 RepID=A0A6P5FL95_ANACO|nr:mitogen-activated protein kinase kinase 1-like isoform X1 [Ananas comosus]